MEEKKNEMVNNYAKEIRNLITQETKTVNDRMNWLLILEGLLFSIYGSNMIKVEFMHAVISVLGLAITLCMLVSFRSCEKAIRFILKNWDQFLAANQTTYDKYPPVWAWSSGNESKLENILEAHKFIPFVLLLAWIAIILYQFFLLFGVLK